MNTIEILKAARELIAKPNGWTQRVMARNDSGAAVAASDSEASCFCAWGAIRAAGGDWEWPALKALDGVAGERVETFNDAPGRTQAEVVAKFDEAIAAEEAKVAAV